MQKLVALSCVLGWSAFWAFGYLALSTEPHETTQASIAALLAFAGLIAGSFSYMRLGRDQRL
jgi:hypothetical protein